MRCRCACYTNSFENSQFVISRGNYCPDIYKSYDVTLLRVRDRRNTGPVGSTGRRRSRPLRCCARSPGKRVPNQQAASVNTMGRFEEDLRLKGTFEDAIKALLRPVRVRQVMPPKSR